VGLVWDDAYRFGDAEIDEQHQHIFALAARLIDDAETGQGDVVEILADLLTHASYHFAAEEALMASVGYPDLASHRAVHTAFADELMAMAERLRAAAPDAMQEIAGFVESWIRGHICFGSA